MPFNNSCKEYRDKESRFSTANAFLAAECGELLGIKKSSCGDTLSQEHHPWGNERPLWFFFELSSSAKYSQSLGTGVMGDISGQLKKIKDKQHKG